MAHIYGSLKKGLETVKTICRIRITCRSLFVSTVQRKSIISNLSFRAICRPNFWVTSWQDNKIPQVNTSAATCHFAWPLAYWGPDQWNAIHFGKESWCKNYCPGSETACTNNECCPIKQCVKQCYWKIKNYPAHNQSALRTVNMVCLKMTIFFPFFLSI